MIKYLGSKRLLIPALQEAVGHLLPNGGKVLDLFSGTSRVGIALKNDGYEVRANDNALFAYHLARCYVEADSETYLTPSSALVNNLNRMPRSSVVGHFTYHYSQEARFFQEKNALRVEDIREELEDVQDPVLKSIGLVSLMEAADRVDSTCGVQMAYLKKWASRSENDLELRVPALTKGKGKATCLDAVDCLRQDDSDLVYIDPPYNQHSYLGNYHIWETLCRWDEPDVYGVAQKRVDVKTRKSAFNFKRKAFDALSEVISELKSPRVLVSFNSTGHVTKDQILGLLKPGYKVTVIPLEHKSYIGYKIGVYNPEGKQVGTEGSPTTTEYLFLGERR